VILPDVNVLIYAFRADDRHHAQSKAWLDRVIASDAHFGITPLVLSAVVRICTDARVFKEPSSVDDAFGFCKDVLDQPHCEIVQPGERHWQIFERLCVTTNTRGARVTDVWFAALAIEHGCTWITYDRDYARFPGLDWQVPDT
jgi:uncharacterized protein